MKLRNSFTEESRALFLDAQYRCFNRDCTCNGQACGGIELHHIKGRESNSPYNGAVLCHGCHSHVGHTDEEHRYLLNKTLYYLSMQDYEPNKRDRKFIRDNVKFYE